MIGCNTAENDHRPMGLDVHLRGLEAEAIGILREARAKFLRPVMLYSIGKDSSVLYHLARKAFAPTALPLPLMHIDTTFKFRDMIAFRDEIMHRDGVNLIKVVNHQALNDGMNPFDFDASVYTAAMKTMPLRAALDAHGFDCAIGGARRDEERSRAKERIFSLREPGHIWEPRNQRPEFFNLYNTSILPGSTMRCFPLSNWTEIDVWRYILAEKIEVVSLYFAALRSVIRRNGQLIPVDDDRFPLHSDEKIENAVCSFPYIGMLPIDGCY